jgi:hypothetical protein
VPLLLAAAEAAPAEAGGAVAAGGEARGAHGGGRSRSLSRARRAWGGRVRVAAVGNRDFAESGTGRRRRSLRGRGEWGKWGSYTRLGRWGLGPRAPPRVVGEWRDGTWHGHVEAWCADRRMHDGRLGCSAVKVACVNGPWLFGLY